MKNPDQTKWVTSLLKPLFLAFIFSFQMGFAQNDSLQDSLRLQETQIKVKQLIIPAAMVTDAFEHNIEIVCLVDFFKNEVKNYNNCNLC